MNAMGDELDRALQTLRRAGAANVVDLMGASADANFDETVSAVTYDSTFAGRALVAEVQLEPGSSLTGYGIGELLDGLRSQDVLVVSAMDGHGTVVGDLAAQGVRFAGGNGMVVFGAVRDVEGMNEAQIPVFAREVGLKSGVKEHVIRSVAEGIDVAGSTIKTGDIIVGSRGGVCWFAESRLGRMRRETEVLLEAEERLLDAFEDPTESFDAAWKRFK